LNLNLSTTWKIYPQHTLGEHDLQMVQPVANFRIFY